MCRVRLAVWLLIGILAGCRQAAPDPAPRDPATGAARPARVELAVPGQPQGRSLSCESRSACDLLAFYGVPCDEDAFFDALPKSDNPHEGFVGDVDGPGEQLPPAGYGVYAEPIAAGIRARGLPASASSGRDVAWVKDQLAQRRPVIVWAPGTLQARRPVRLVDSRGRPFMAVRGEHTFIAVGYERGELLLLDPANGRVRRVFERRFDDAWAVLGRMAVVVEPE